MVLLEDNSVLPHYLDNTVIHSIITSFLILNTSVDKLQLLGIFKYELNVKNNYKFEINFIS